MSTPSFWWYALADVGRPPDSEAPWGNRVQSLALAVAQAEWDRLEVHQGEGLVGRSVAGWRARSAAFDPQEVNRVMDEEAPALALVKRGVAFWELPQEVCLSALQKIVRQEFWAVLQSLLALPDRPDWRDLLDMTNAAFGNPQTLWGDIAQHPNLVVALVKSGLPPDYRHHHGETLLFANPSIELARWCVEQGTPPDALNADGKTAAAVHQSRLTSLETKPWFTLCGLGLLTDQQVFDLAASGNKGKFNAVVTDPLAWSWAVKGNRAITVLEHAMMAALPKDRALTSPPTLFMDLARRKFAWPEEALGLASLGWIALDPDERNRSSKPPHLKLDLPYLVEQLPTWVPRMSAIYPDVILDPYCRWWEFSDDVTWRNAVVNSLRSHLNEDSKRWKKRRWSSESSSIVNATSVNSFLEKGTQSEIFQALDPINQFTLIAWWLVSCEVLDPDYHSSLRLSSEVYQEQKVKIERGKQEIYRLFEAGAIHWEDPQWNPLREAAATLVSDPLAEIQACFRAKHLKQMESEQPVAKAKPRWRPRS